MSTINQLRGGKDCEATFGSVMRGHGVYADLLERRFQLATKRLGFSARHQRPLETGLFKPHASHRRRASCSDSFGQVDPGLLGCS